MKSYHKIFYYPKRWAFWNILINLLFLCVIDIVKVALNMFSYREVGDHNNHALRLISDYNIDYTSDLHYSFQVKLALPLLLLGIRYIFVFYLKF